VADDLIDIVVRLRNALGAARDARRVASGIDEIGDEARQAAEALALMNAETGRGSKGSRSFAKNLNNVSGRLNLVTVAGAVLGPSVLSIASSAAGAAAGLGVLGATAGGAAAVGLGSLFVVGKQAFGMMGDLNTAQKAYNLAVQQYGKDSKQAKTAHEHLLAVQKVAGPQATKLAKQWNKLGRAFRGQTGDARRNLLTTAIAGLHGASRLLPSITKAATSASRVVRKGLVGAFHDLSGGETQQTLSTLSKTFNRAFGPALRGGVDLVHVLMRVLRAGAPYVVQAARGFRDWAAGLRQSTAHGNGVVRMVALLVGHLKSWLGLTKAIGRLFLAIFGKSNQAGRGLVDVLTSIVNGLTRIVQSSDQSWWTTFAQLAAQLAGHLVQLGGILMQIATAAMPGLAVAAKITTAVLGALSSVVRFLSPLIGPLVVAFLAFRSALVASRIAMTLLSVAFRLTPFGWVVTAISLLVAAVILMWNKWAGFRNFIKGVWSWIKTAAGDTWDWVTSRIRRFVEFVSGLPGKISAGVSGIWDGLKQGLIDVLNFIIDKLNWLIRQVNRIPGVSIGQIGAIADTARTRIADQGRIARGNGYNGGGTYVPPVTQRRGTKSVAPGRAGGRDPGTAGQPTRGIQAATARVLQPVHWNVNGKTLASVMVDVSEAAEARG
jgi:hypothetical protein